MSDHIEGHNGDALLYGHGQEAWMPARYLDVADGTFSGEGRKIVIGYNGEESYQQLRRALTLVVRRDGLSIKHYSKDVNSVSIVVDDEDFEKVIAPRIEGYERAANEEATNAARGDELDTIMAHRVHALLFEKGWKAWGAHPSELSGNEYCRAFSSKDLQVGERTYSLKEVTRLAQEILRDELDITARERGAVSLRSFANEKLGHCYFALPEQDYRKLEHVLDPRSPGLFENNMRHPLLAKAHDLKLEGAWTAKCVQGRLQSTTLPYPKEEVSGR